MAINLPNYERQTEILNNTNEILDEMSRVGSKPRRQVFKTNGTWTAPAGVTKVFITGGGAGGGGAVVVSAGNGVVGNSGGITSFGTLLTLTGGGGGNFGAISAVTGGERGGEGGEPGNILSIFSGSNISYGAGDGGDSGRYKGGKAKILPSNNTEVFNQLNGDVCSGGAAAIVASSTNNFATGGGGGMFVENLELTVIPGNSYSITIGVGGGGGTSGSNSGGKGGNGILILEWWE